MRGHLLWELVEAFSVRNISQKLDTHRHGSKTSTENLPSITSTELSRPKKPGGFTTPHQACPPILLPQLTPLTQGDPDYLRAASSFCIIPQSTPRQQTKTNPVLGMFQVLHVEMTRQIFLHKKNLSTGCGCLHL